MTLIVLAGALAGIGLFLLALSLQRPATRGSGAPAALARMDLEQRRQREVEAANIALARQLGDATAATSGALATRLRPAGRKMRGQLEQVGLQLPAGVRADLSLTGRSVDAHVAISLSGAILGAALGSVFAVLVMVALQPGLPWTTVLIVALIGAVLGLLVPTAQLASRATVRRRDFRHVVGSFLDLVSMNLSGGRGVPEALTAAASISDGWAMVRIRECLALARLQGLTPWLALGELGQDTGVVELRDLSAALELVADDGAKIRESLAARAASLRRRELADAEGKAQARSQSMLVAQLLLAFGFLLFLMYPAISKVLAPQ